MLSQELLELAPTYRQTLVDLQGGLWQLQDIRADGVLSVGVADEYVGLGQLFHHHVALVVHLYLDSLLKRNNTSDRQST